MQRSNIFFVVLSLMFIAVCVAMAILMKDKDVLYVHMYETSAQKDAPAIANLTGEQTAFTYPETEASTAYRGPVNINTDDKDTLVTLYGVGESIAERIIQYRTENGDFQSPEDIMKVKGIGEKIYGDNKERITIG
ncbi:hypothetical protein FACS189499_00900 [Clostridia bacterium]|nr:hypothetical protein FACS189499_00900 [Clostridia bacterium]